MRLGHASKILRAADGRGIREVAKEIGISPATLSRIEREQDCGMRSFVKLLTWLMGDRK